MSTAVVRRLPELAAAINREHTLCYRTAMTHALKAGALLAEVKAQLDHGDWLPWVEEHLVFDERTARGYMQLASLPEANRRRVADLGIKDALHAIAKPKEDRPPPSVDLRSAFGGTDQAELDAALAELDAAPRPSRFPDSEAERDGWRAVLQAVERVKRFMDDASREGLSPWSRREALYEASRQARNASARLTALGDELTA